MNTFDNINSAQALRQIIQELEIRQDEEREEIHQSFKDAYESVKPINLIKSTVKDAVESLDLKDNLVNTGIGLAAGYLGKTVYEASSNGAFKKVIGSGLMFLITNLVTKNPEVVKSFEEQVITFLKSKLNNQNNNDEEE